MIAEALAANKYVTALDTAPVVLADAGVLGGIRATCNPWGTPEQAHIHKLQNAGAEWVNEPVVVSGSIITARDVTSGVEFGRVLARQLGKRPL